ncbi:MAG: DEAD/DEAH box helicase family protein [Acidimicrobiia bacterium]
MSPTKSSVDDFLSVAAAADYLGVSPQTLRRWDQSGKLPATRRPGSNYRYYQRTQLEEYRLQYMHADTSGADIGGIFSKPANIAENQRLREPQRGAYKAVREHFAHSTDPAMLVIPVGCGKTGVISTLPFGIAHGRVLVIAPNLTIRKGITDALDIASTDCFWAKARVLSDFQDGPYTAVLDGPDANIHDCTESHFVVTNIQQLASSADRWLPQFPPNFFDLILIDEGHHSAAESWKKVLRRFPDAKVVSLTATPFRGDRQPLPGEVIYRYSFTRAMMHGYIKQLSSINVAPSEVSFRFRGDERRHTLEEVMSLREETWFRRGVALSPECNRHIVESSINHCNAMRARTGVAHQIIASACSVDHARQVRALYEECGYRAAAIHSHLPDVERDQIISDLRRGNLDAIVQVQVLGEGFDHPPLSVAAVFRPFRSLAPYIQFVGRAMRVVHQDEPDHPDNNGFIISHVGLNNDEHWEDFRELDLDDQEMVRRWLDTEEIEMLEGGYERSSGEPRRFDEVGLVNTEIVSHFITQSFLDPEDDRVIEALLDKPIAGGLQLRAVISAEKLREALREQQASGALEPSPIPATPQRRRRTARRRLVERTGSVVARVLKDAELSRQGRNVSKAMKVRPPMSNVQAVTRLLNTKINESVGIASSSRNELTADEAEEALSRLDLLGDELVEEIVQALGVKVGN